MRKTTPPTDTAEAQLESLIEECRQIIRDLVLPSAAAARDGLERRRYLDCAVDLVRIGATVGDSIARLRGGAAAEHRQRITVERVQSRPALPGLPACPTPGGEGG